MNLTQVRKLHDRYGAEAARWGDENQATIRALIAYHEAREAYEAKTGKRYRR